MRRPLLVLAAVLVLALAAAGAYLLYERQQGRDVRGSASVEFASTDVGLAQAPAAGGAEAGVVWPAYGYDARRLRAASSALRPPFRVLWSFRAAALIEFPPAIAYGRLYFANNDGAFFSLDAGTGKAAWTYRSGRCVAAAPAVAGGVVYESFLNRPPCNATRSGLDGEVVALDARSGRVRWQRTIAPSESSPLYADGLVYVGDWSGAVLALDARTGATRWRFVTGGKVKGGVALAHGRVFVGSYDGNVYALDASTGRLAWRAPAQSRLGSTGTFYSTPAAAYDRVYIGCTDGKVYSYGAGTGALRWSHSTGGYVYASPAVWRGLVLAGSYSGAFDALDAATGATRWSFRADGPISGSATVLGDVVYVSTLARTTYALDAATGRELWRFPDGKYAAAVADAVRLYLVGETRLYAMVER